jgi:WD40 repeat protein
MLLENFFRFRQGTVFLLDFSGGSARLVHRLRGHDDEVYSVSWCPVPGETFLKGSDDGDGFLTGTLIIYNNFQFPHWVKFILSPEKC